MPRVKAVQLAANELLPENLRDYNRSLDAKDIAGVLAEVAKAEPERYNEVATGLMNLGRHLSYRQGETLRLEDMKPVIDRDVVMNAMDAEIDEARKHHGKDKGAFEKAREEIWHRYVAAVEKNTLNAGLAAKNNLAYSVASGARGKAPQIRMMVSMPGLFEDSSGSVVPMFIRHSYGEGLRPADYLASSFGSRATVISTKRATAKGGFWAKQVAQATTPLVVTTKDCGVDNGLAMDADDAGIKYRVLVKPVAGIPAGHIIDKEAMQKIRKSGVDNIIVRSPMTCQAPVGLCSKCMGTDARGHFPSIGDSVGITAANALGEPVTQMALNAKHQGGAAGGKKEFAGFHYINQFTQAPEDFPDRAAVSELDGKVEKIEPAPQGGNIITVNGEGHYIAPGFDPVVKIGETVEAGDQLTEGLVNPSDVVRLKGLGAGRKYYVDRLGKILADSGMPADKRNLETVARAAVDHLTVHDDESLPGSLPGDEVSYNFVSKSYVPPENTRLVAPRKAVSMYLQAPALHYTIGTKLSPKVVEDLHSKGMQQIAAAPEAPGFKPQMVRLQSAMRNQPDWIAAMHTSHLKRQLGEAAVAGDDTNIRDNVHFAPPLAFGEGYGENVAQTGKF